MSATSKTGKLLKPQIAAIRWYPNSRSLGGKKRSTRLNLMPPLMVRKPEWRR